jgi:hypothetical protein
MSNTEKAIKEITLEDREREVRFKLAQVDQQLANIEHIKTSMKAIHENDKTVMSTSTQTITKMVNQFTEGLKANGHLCINGERITRVEGTNEKILGIAEDTKKTVDKIEKHIEKLFERAEANSKRIDRIETIGGIVVTVTIAGWAIFVWLAEKVVWK